MTRLRRTNDSERATRAVSDSFMRHLVGVNGIRTFYDGLEPKGGSGFTPAIGMICGNE